MIKKFTLTTLTLFAISTTSVQAAQECLDVGGYGTANLVNGGGSIVADLTGSFSNARGEITSTKETSTGMQMDMAHWFMISTGGSFQTKDKAILTAVKGKDKQFMVNITYNVQKETTSGTFKGYSGQYKSYGLADLEKGQVVIRYSGKICK